MRAPRSIVIALATSLLLVGCEAASDDPLVTGVNSPLQSSELPCDPADAWCIVEKLFPAELQLTVWARYELIVELLADPEALDAAQDEMFALVQYTLDHWYGGRLGQKGSLTSAFIDVLYVTVGLAAPQLTEADLTDPSGVGVIGPGGGTVTTRNQLAGTDIPAGTFAESRTVVVRPLPFPTVPGQGPLPTSLPQYPRFYDVETFPPGPLNQNVVVGVCVVDPPDPFAPPAAALPRLRLGHESSPGVLDILPLAPAPFLNCVPAGSSLIQAYEDNGPIGWLAAAALRVVAPGMLIADPGGVGGAAGSFSAFGAVDPGTRVANVSVAPATSRIFYKTDSRCESTQVQLTVDVTDDQGQLVSGVAVTWSSSAPGVAAVDDNGLVSAVGSGPGGQPLDVTITATADGVDGTATVTVVTVACGTGGS